ncbi:MAG: DUF928 domain-containing protein [Cyanobacteria bacterium P01_H01_bin.15]
MKHTRARLFTLVTLAGMLVHPAATQALEFPNAPERQTSRSSVGGARRGGPSPQIAFGGRYNPGACSAESELPEVLMPRDRIQTKASLSPSWIALIPASNRAERVEIELVDQESNLTLQTASFELPQSSGLVEFLLPELSTEQSDKVYRWQLTLECTVAGRQRSESIWGKIELSDLTPQQAAELNNLRTPRAQAEFYANNGFWNEAVAAMLTARANHPQDWADLLASVGITQPDMIEAPLAGTVQAEQAQSVLHRLFPALTMSR